MQNEFPNAKNVCYLNSASEGILPQSAFKALQEMATRKQRPQMLGDEEYYNLPPRCRLLLSTLLHCSPDEIGLIGSTSFGMGSLALSLPLKSGDEVLLVERDFPSNNFAWEAIRERGVRLRHVPFVPDAQQTSRVIDAISDATRVLSISPVHFYTGFRYDLPALSDACRKKDVLLIVDAIHLVGNEPVDLERTPVDALCAAAHKWQLSPSGTGFLYINRNLMPRLKPPFTGWMHNKNATDFAGTSMFEFEPSPFARRFELGTEPVILLAAYEQSLMLLNECRMDYVQPHNGKLVDKLISFFRDIGWPVADIPRSSSIFSIVPPDRYDAWSLLQELANQEIFIALREGHLRISPHFYTSDADITRFCDVFRKLL